MSTPLFINQLASIIAHASSLEMHKRDIGDWLIDQFGVDASTYDSSDLFEENNIRCYLLNQSNLRIGLHNLLGGRSVTIAFARELANKYGHEITNRLQEEDALDLICKLLNIKIIQRPPQYGGFSFTERKLKSQEATINSIRSSSAPKLDLLEQPGFASWKLLEQELKFSCRYYRALFIDNGIKEDIKQVFESAVKRSSLRPLIMDIFRVEMAFRKDNDAQRLAQRLLNRSSPFEKFFHESYELERGKTDPLWMDELRKTAQHTGQFFAVQDIGIDADPESYIAINTDWLVNRIEDTSLETITIPIGMRYYADADFYRNSYAHEVVNFTTTAAIQHAIDSFYTAKTIIDRMHKYKIIPELIIPIEIGQDGHGRIILHFIREHELNDDGTYSFKNANCAFLKSPDIVSLTLVDQVSLFEFYVCPPSEADVLIEPPIYPLQAIYPEAYRQR